ncbi:TPM domain-containing protein, partial [Calditerricola satsumensis]
MKRRAVLLALAMVVAFFCLRASAQALPPWQDRPVLDEARLFSAPERQQMEELIRAFPYPVTVVVVPTMNGRAPDDVAREAFAAYGLDPRHLLLVVDAQRGALGVYAGAALAKAGLSAEWLAEKRRIFFEPYEKQNEIATGVAAFLQAVLDDTAQMAAAANLPR